MTRHCLLLLLMLLATPAAAQDRVDSLRGVEVRDTRSVADLKGDFQPGSSGAGIDSQLRRAYDQQQISTLLTMSTAVFVRSYGINSLATLGFRGASSAQSAVLWEGVPLMNAATGVADISLLPVGFSDSIAIRYGGSGALDGSGNVGGALLLQGRAPRFSERPRASGFLQGGFGSFGQVPVSAGIALSTRRVEVRIRGLRQVAANDFQGTDQYGARYRTEHARMRGLGGLAELAYRLSARDLLRVHAWLQDYQREIPRALFETFSDKQQDESSARYLLHYTHSGTSWQAYAKLAYIDERFEYQMPSAQINTAIRTRQVFIEAGAQRQFGRWGRVLVFAPVQVSLLQSQFRDAGQERIALAGAWRRSWRKGTVQTALNLRAEQIDGRQFVLPGVSASWQLREALGLRASLQRSYRAPTLNELYYEPGGNPNLRAEQGWSGELGYTYIYARGTGWEFRHELTGYARLIDDWIIWLGGAIWTPHNLAQVFSRGLETTNTLERRLGAYRIVGGLGLGFTRSTPTKTLQPNDQSVGRQIPYTPSLTGNLRLGLGWKRYELSYLQMFASRRYTTSDESNWLPAYTTADLIASAQFLQRPQLGLQLSMRNIYNAEYAVVAGRPMPGRSLLLGIRLEF